MTRKKRTELPPEDDGRTIVSMNVDGMPWYTPARKEAPRNVPESADNSTPKPIPYTMTKEESRLYYWGAVKAGLIVVLTISAFLVLFILFCQFVWFR